MEQNRLKIVMMLGILLIGIFSSSVFAFATESAENRRVALVYRGDLSFHQVLIKNLEAEMGQMNPEIQVINWPVTSEWNDNDLDAFRRQKPSLIIVFGDTALTFCLQTETNANGIFLFVAKPKLAVRAMEKTGKWTGTFLWVDPAVQLRQIKLLFPKIKTLGLLTSGYLTSQLDMSPPSRAGS
ncbi:MAG: hypothetical protein JXO49_06600 [Deltaproteobacteria bacterium]|nr:hypothetical protein [Candidatus Anaeroferrophillus wilburensis]MBN2888997.1 hypothetical protein [Deltaproteobacteria bacterium]